MAYKGSFYAGMQSIVKCFLLKIVNEQWGLK